MKKLLIGILLISILLISIPAIIPVAVAQELPRGPRADQIIFIRYPSTEHEALAVQAGDVVMHEWGLTGDIFERIKADPNLQFFTAPDFGFFGLGFNCREGNFPFGPAPDIGWTAKQAARFRYAFNFLVDRERVVSELLKGLGYPIWSVVPKFYGKWYNPNVPKDKYDPSKAAEIFFKELGLEKKADGIYWKGHKIPPIIFYARVDDPVRKTIGEWVTDELKKLGFIVDLKYVTAEGADVVYEDQAEWDVYTFGWGLGIDPDHPYWFFHSKFTTGALSWLNFVNYVNKTLDKLLEKIEFSPTEKEVKEALFKAQIDLYYAAPYVNIYARVLVHAARKEWTGFVPMTGAGIENFWTYFNAHPRDRPYGGTLKVAVLHTPKTFNYHEYTWYWDAIVLGLIYDGLIAINPFTLEDMPWLAEKWEMREMTPEELKAHNVSEGLVITFHLVKNATWHDGKPLTADDVVFTYEYIIKHPTKRGAAVTIYLAPVKPVEKVDDYTVRIYTNTKSYWTLHLILYPIFPKHLWQYVEDPATFDPLNPPDEWKAKTGLQHAVIGSGPYVFAEYKVGEYVKLVANRNYFKKPMPWLEAYKPVEVPKVELPLSVVAGDKLVIKVPVLFGGKPAIPGEEGVDKVTVTVSVIDVFGRTVWTGTAKHIGGGVYQVEIDTSGFVPGTYNVYIEVIVVSRGVPFKYYETKAFAVVGKEIKELGEKVKKVSESLEKLKESVKSDIESVSKEVAGVKETVGKLSATVEELRKALPALGETVGKSIEGVGESIKKLSTAIDKVGKAVDSVSKAVGETGKAIDALRGKIDELGSKLDKLDRATSDLSDTVSKVSSDVASLKESVNSLAGTISTIMGIVVVNLILSLVAIALTFRKK